MLGKKVFRGSALLLALISFGCCKIPSYSPGFWNDGNGVQWNNNCYNYSNNKRTDTFAQPGKASGITLSWPTEMNCSAVTNGAVADGVLQPLFAGICFFNQDKIAMVIAPDWDYHWYRQDTNGMWSHKPGGTMATNLDNAGNPIANPETAARGSYTVFCGYFCSCSGDDQGQGRENIQ